MKNRITKTLRGKAGFTLVELIVVIAILGILAGVGTVGYSGYIKKANQAADEQLIASVKNALQLGAIGNFGQNDSGYVVLSTSAAPEIVGDSTEEYLNAAFGSDLSGLKLKYDGWELSTNLPSAEDAEKVAKSSYYQNSTPAELVSSFTGLTDALAGMASTASQDPLETMDNLGLLPTDMREKLSDLGVSWNSEAGADNTAYTTAVSNLLVQNVATEIGNNQYTGADGETPSGMAELAMSYALIYGWASTDAEGAAILAELNAAVTDENANSASVVNAVEEAMTAAAEKSGFETYMAENGQYSNDLSALAPIMSTVSKWSDSADMTTSGLYSADSITDAVNNYITAVGAMSGLENASELGEVLEDGVVVFISASGTVGCNISLS